MHINFYHPLTRYAQVYLDGQKLTRCIDADEESGLVVCLRMKNDLPISEHFAERGDLLCENHIVDILQGKVEIQFDEEMMSAKLKPEQIEYYKAEEFRPLYIHQVVHNPVYTTDDTEALKALIQST